MEHHGRQQPARWRARVASIALAAAVPLAFALPVSAQEHELAPLDAMRAEFDTCIASGIEGSLCAAGAKLYLDAILSGGNPVSTGTGAAAAPAPVSTSAGGQTSSASGADGEVSNGRDEPATTDDTAGQDGDPALAGDATPAPTTGAPPAAAPSDSTTSTTTTTGSDAGTTNTSSGAVQTNDASGTDGGRPRQ